MAYAITQTCCSDASCVSVCPVNCIHPRPDEPDFGTTEMLYIDPQTCIDCGACADACPVGAIFPAENLTGPLKAYPEVNASYYADRAPTSEEPDPAPNFHAWGPPVFDRTIPSDFAPLDVAVVGTGPAGMYAVEDLLLHTNARVTLIDRLPEAGGLVRYGVAPDHVSTKQIGETFARFHTHPRLTMRLGLEIGRDVTVDELAEHHDAVIYAVGASSARRLGIRGEDLPGSVAATTVVAWYNGHPDVPADAIDLSAERVVVVGTGNVALDAARILTMDPSTLENTAIAPAILDKLRSSGVREVVLLGRRGPEAAAYTSPELLGIAQREDVELVVDAHDAQVGQTIDAAASEDKAGLLRGLPRETVDWSAPPAHGGRRIVLRFHSAPREILGDTEVRGLRATGRTDDVEIAAGRVIRAVGYRGAQLTGLPFDEESGTIPHAEGRVDGLPGTYVVGWIKRGPSGGIGANKVCARETVGTLLDDAIAGRLPRPRRGRKAFAALSARRLRRRRKRAAGRAV
ncbi:ferredoxin--NADP+ reductase [Halopolyspora algeriensis]|uniref:ferredoxin--NADP(+) reductase n=1 Tax=Halopolyspora algeriensis TaxID=1500506 RepID=A0A368W021_9ACTN|nr:FAD-dependent oxidoreductase [Halopolyspora algeriensis]RCW45931.1 ferredoxin--NADP+ reductase [Halopolyspora algeriensis]TQM55344.1 ferredoxin--NADP+ reductase [Halopolyspora algeriensis]